MASGFAGQGGSFGMGTVNEIGGAVNDIFGSQMQAKSLELKAKGDQVEAADYLLAAQLAGENEQYTEQSFAVKQAQTNREIEMSMGDVEAGVASNGFNLSGSGLDILKDSAQQGALQKQLLAQQGLITEEGYKVSQQQYQNMAQYAQYAAGVEQKMAKEQKMMGYISAGIKVAGAIASMA